MATIQSIVREKNVLGDTLHHYDINYQEGFVVTLYPNELTNPNDTAEIISKANTKAAVIVSRVPTTESEEIALP